MICLLHQPGPGTATSIDLDSSQDVRSPRRLRRGSAQRLRQQLRSDPRSGPIVANNNNAGTRFAWPAIDAHRVMEQALYPVNHEGPCIAGGPNYAFKAQQREAVAGDDPADA